jgi:hypothetical protein
MYFEKDAKPSITICKDVKGGYYFQYKDIKLMFQFSSIYCNVLEESVSRFYSMVSNFEKRIRIMSGEVVEFERNFNPIIYLYSFEDFKPIIDFKNKITKNVDIKDYYVEH